MINLEKSRKNVPMLSVIDDGQGMNHDEVVKMVSFGHKQLDKDDKDHIGRFGVGFKVTFFRSLSLFCFFPYPTAVECSLNFCPFYVIILC